MFQGHKLNWIAWIILDLWIFQVFPPAAGAFITTNILQWSFDEHSFWRTPDMATVLDIAKSIALIGWREVACPFIVSGFGRYSVAYPWSYHDLIQQHQSSVCHFGFGCLSLLVPIWFHHYYLFYLFYYYLMSTDAGIARHPRSWDSSPPTKLG